MACPEKIKRRQSLLAKLKDLVDNIDDKSECCGSPACCPPCVCCPAGPVIEIYDPLPKPCLPLCSPCTPNCGGCPAPCCPAPCCPAPCCPAPCCPAPCCPAPCCPAPCCPPPSKTCPVPLCPPCVTPVVPPCMPICTPCPPPCVPICNPCQEEQPCVPCNPPQMMVCYRIPQSQSSKNNVKRSKSKELRAGVLYSTCDCIKRNGLQDDCPRLECHGSPACLTQPEPSCGPAEIARLRHQGQTSNSTKKGKTGDLSEYQCYPAYVKLPGGPSPCCPPACPCPCPCPCSPGVPLVAAPPCPPPICPGPPPLLPIGNVFPVCQPCPCPC